MSGYLDNKLWIRQVPSYYSSAQVRSYLQAVKFQPLLKEDDIVANRFPRSVETLERLMRHHLLSFPFENTEMHYTESRIMDVTPQGAFYRFVTEGKGKGSYCFGHNTVFLGILRGLGFRAYSCAARVNQNWMKADMPEAYGSHTHMAIFIQPYDNSNRTWVVDVGFGAGTLIRPIPLLHGDNSMVLGVGPTEVHRLMKTPHSMSSLSASSESDSPSGQELWTLQLWRGKEVDIGSHSEGPWHRQIIFSEQEFFPADHVDASFTVSQRSGGLLASQVVCVKHFVDENGEGGHLYRVVMYSNEVRRQVHGEGEVIRTLGSELDRLKALREVFGLYLDDDAIGHIQGRVPALRP